MKALGNYFLESAFDGLKTLIPIRQSVWHNPLSAHSQWHNLINPSDVNGDGVGAALDALLVFNALNDRRQLATVVGDESAPRLLDTNGDRHLSPVDALIIINEMNAHGRRSFSRSG